MKTCRKEYAIEGGVGLTVKEHLEKFHQRAADKLARRLRFFSTELARETNSRKIIMLRKSLAACQREQVKMLYGWTHCEIRRRAIRKGQAGFVSRNDKILSAFNRKNNGISDNDCKYREAGRIIKRIRKTI